MAYSIIHGDCTQEILKLTQKIDLIFLDPPFNQGKDYNEHNVSLPEDLYWSWMLEVCLSIYNITNKGGVFYFMQREKNTEHVLRVMRESGWNLQNLIIWKKKTSAVPCSNRFGKHYQIIVYAIKGDRPRIFNRLRINPPLPPNYKFERQEGMYVTDVWDDIRELTSGYFAGDEALRNPDGSRFHKQQSPIQLLLRIILSSTLAGDTVFDPFTCTGTTLVVAEQLNRNSIEVEKYLENVRLIKERLEIPRDADRIGRFYGDYIFTETLDKIWGVDNTNVSNKKKQNTLFEVF